MHQQHAEPWKVTVVDTENSDSRRADDILASDPVRAYAEQAESLERRLNALKEDCYLLGDMRPRSRHAWHV